MAGFTGGMAQGINSGISLFNAIENKKHRDRMFEYQQNRDDARDKQWEATHNQRQGEIDQRQANWETLRTDEKIARQYDAFSQTMNSRLADMTENPAAQAEFIRQHSGELKQFINSGYIVGAQDFGKRVKNGYEFDHFTPELDDNGQPTGRFMAALRNKETGETRPMTKNASSDANDPVVAFTFDDLAHGVSNGGYANILRARDAYAATVGELKQQGGQEYQQARAQLQALDEALAKLEDDQPLTEQEEQLVAGLEQQANQWAADTPAGGQQEFGPSLQAPAKEEEARPRNPSRRSAAGSGFTPEQIAEAERSTGWGQTLRSPGQAMRDRQGSEPRTPSLSDATRQQQVPAQQVREQLEAQRAEVKQSLDAIKQRKGEISGSDWRKFAKQHGISLADPESARQMAMALRHGDANITDADIQRLQREQQTLLRQERTEIRQFRSDLLSGLPKSVTDNDYFNKNEWGAAIDLILEDLDPGTFSQMPQSMMRRAVAGARDSTEVALNLYSMAYSINPQELSDAVQGYMDSTGQQATPEVVQQIGEHLRSGGHMADFGR